ncbi:ABC transporter permease [Saccharibacillus sp. JS10]|uniref:ABC transporter permease n=1 Tax=Saccharibacillus sp. JS10 TaxID=2950552 RepID=UPI00210D02B6|nr:ABC transporter permease subunit [Saccharibacillus sp. JS10]MCQ4088239.1 ABC transporter permease [Saccharibacillus sp. JS10]
MSRQVPLSGMIKRVTAAELYKIFAQFKYRLIPFGMALVPIILLLLNQRSNSLIRFSPENLPYTLLSIAATILLPLVACMLAADLFAGERERGELKISLTRPVSRTALAIGKITAILTYLAGLLVILMVLSLVVTIVSGVAIGQLNGLHIVGAYLLTLLPLAAVSAAAALASTLARSATSGFVLGIVLLVVLNGLALAFPSISSVFFTEYAGLYKNIVGAEVSWTPLLIGVGLLLGSMTVLTTTQLLVFDAKEV